MNANNNNNNHNRHRIVNRGQRVMFPRESLRRRRSPSVNTAIEYSEAEAVSRKYMTASINNRLCRLSINHSKDSLNNPIFPDDNMATLRYGEQATLLEEARQQLKMIVNGILPLSSSFEVENAVVGRPDVQCGIDNIVVNVNTEKPLKGRIYVQGEAEDPQCVRSAKNEPFDHPHFDIPIGMCNMKRQRTLHPRGVAFSFTLVVSFHPLFVTGIDRAFNVRCFFLESVKSLNTNVDVGILTTEVLEQDFSLPTCLYQLKDGLEGPALTFAQVGQRVTHLWHCDESVSLVYGILIHSCFAGDGQGNKFQLVDDRGCSTDPWLLPQIQYQANAISAFTNTQVFKYADKVQLFFTCTVQLCYKHDGGCEEITPPKCGTSPTDALSTNTNLNGTPFKISRNENIQNTPQHTPFVHLSQNPELDPKLHQLDFPSPSHPHTKHENTPNEQLGEHLIQEPFKGPIPDRAFFGPIPRNAIPNQIRPQNEKINFLQTPYKDSPINETDSDDLQTTTSRHAEWMKKNDTTKLSTMNVREPTSPVLLKKLKSSAPVSNSKSTESIDVNREISNDSEKISTKKRRDIDMETDLHVDVIVLPFEDKKRSARNFNFPPVEVCVSRTATIIILSTVILTIIVCTTMAFLSARRCTVYERKEIDAFN